MPSKRTLNAKNLKALGAERLAALLIELTSGDVEAKRRLRLELAGAESPSALAGEVRKRLGAIGRSRSFVDWHRIRKLAKDLDTQRRTITEQIAKADAGEALELMWRFMALASPVFERCDDSNGVVSDVFHTACSDLGDIARTAAPDPAALADRAFEALRQSHYGQFDDLIQILAPALGAKGLERLKQRVLELSETPVRRPADKDRIRIGISSSGPIYEDELAERARQRIVREALMDIADIQEDVDAFIGQIDEDIRKAPGVAADIASRLLAAGRAGEALQALDAAVHPNLPGLVWPVFDWEDARIEVLEALERPDEAQAVRWRCFERSLSIAHLRAYLKKLPDFEDMEAEEKALDYARSFRSRLGALWFLVSWPALDRASALVLAHANDLDGNAYDLLVPAANALAERYPLAATLVLRAMIDFALTESRSSRYRHAARHLLECASLSPAIEDFGPHETHDDYVERLKAEHGRKRSFWDRVG